MSRKIRNVLTSVVLLGAVYMLVSRVDWPRVLQIVSRAEPAPLLWSVPFLLLGLLAHAWRWCALLPGDLALTRVFHASNLGHAGNLLIPGRAGEPVRVALLSGPGGAGVGKVVGSVVVERLMEQIFRVVFLVAGVSWLGRGHGGDVLISLLVALGLVVGLVVTVRAYPEAVAKVLGYVLQPFLGWSSTAILQQIRDMVVYVEGLSRGELRVFCFRTVVCWTFLAAHTALLLKALGAGSLLAYSLIVMAVATPTAATQPGLYQGVLVAALALVGVDPADGLAWSILLHAVQLILLPLLAIWGYFALGRPGRVSLPVEK